MPVYDYKCSECGEVQTAINKIDDRKTHAPECCGEQTSIKISATMVDRSFLGSFNNPGYRCVVSDKWIDSKNKRRDMMSEHNVIEKG